MVATGGDTTPLSRFAALTGLRGIAAWMVVLFHVRVTLVATLAPWAIHAMARGYLAVDLFFILSGFVMWHAYGDRLSDTGWAGVRQFWWRRIARIWPLHAVVLGGFVLLAVALAVTGRDITPYPFAHLPAHILLIRNWSFAPPMLEWNDPSWSISCEMAAYLLFPAMVMAAPWARLPTVVLVAVAAGLMLGIWAYFAVWGTPGLDLALPRMGLAGALLEFWLGSVVRLLWGRWHGVPGLAAAAWLLVAILLASVWVCGLPESLVMPACFAALVPALAADRGWVARWLGGRLMRYLGEISFSTYLCHYLLFVVFKLVFVHRLARVGALTLPTMSGPQLLLLLALVLAASMALYHGVEKPAQRWLNALAWRRRVVA